LEEISPVSSRTGRTAWLVTWQSVGAHAAAPGPSRVVAVLGPQTGAATVAALLERLYAASTYTPEEMLEALPPRGHNPHKAQYGRTTVVGFDGRLEAVEFLGRITCGHNPHLYARLVDRLRPADETGSGGVRGLLWDERPPPGLKRARRPVRQRRCARPLARDPVSRQGR
jgi:hypothetical protein